MVSVYVPYNLDGWDNVELVLILFDNLISKHLWQEYVDGLT